MVKDHIPLILRVQQYGPSKHW